MVKAVLAIRRLISTQALQAQSSSSTTTTGIDQIMSASLNTNEKSFYFYADVSDSLLLEKIELRSEEEYDKDICAEKTALKYIEKISKCFDGNVYLVTASQGVGPINKMRSKKGVLWTEKKLRNLENYSGEVEVGLGSTRLVSLVKLEDFNFDSAEVIVLSWVFSFILLTKLNVEIISGLVDSWVAKDHKSVLAFNYDAIAKDLSRLSTTSVLRYFPADNGRNETIVVAGNREFVENNVQKCVRSII